MDLEIGVQLARLQVDSAALKELPTTRAWLEAGGRCLCGSLIPYAKAEQSEDPSSGSDDLGLEPKPRSSGAPLQCRS